MIQLLEADALAVVAVAHAQPAQGHAAAIGCQLVEGPRRAFVAAGSLHAAFLGRDDGRTDEVLHVAAAVLHLDRFAAVPVVQHAIAAAVHRGETDLLATTVHARDRR